MLPDIRLLQGQLRLYHPDANQFGPATNLAHLYLRTQPRTLLVRGEPGSGKSALLQHLASDKGAVWAHQEDGWTRRSFGAFIRGTFRQLLTPPRLIVIDDLELSRHLFPHEIASEWDVLLEALISSPVSVVAALRHAPRNDLASIRRVSLHCEAPAGVLDLDTFGVGPAKDFFQGRVSSAANPITARLALSEHLQKDWARTPLFMRALQQSTMDFSTTPLSLLEILPTIVRTNDVVDRVPLEASRQDSLLSLLDDYATACNIAKSAERNTFDTLSRLALRDLERFLPHLLRLLSSSASRADALLEKVGQLGYFGTLLSLFVTEDRPGYVHALRRLPSEYLTFLSGIEFQTSSFFLAKIARFQTLMATSDMELGLEYVADLKLGEFDQAIDGEAHLSDAAASMTDYLLARLKSDVFAAAMPITVFRLGQRGTQSAIPSLRAARQEVHDIRLKHLIDEAIDNVRARR